MSISTKLYEQFFIPKCYALFFLYSFFRPKEIDEKTTFKMLVRLTPDSKKTRKLNQFKFFFFLFVKESDFLVL